MLGLAAAAFAGIGLAVGGLVRASFAAPVAAVVVIATFVLDTLGAALDLPDAVLDLSLYRHLGQPMAGEFDAVGIVVAAVPRDRRAVGRGVGPAAEGPGPLTSRRRRNVPAWTPSSSRWSRSAPLLHVAWNVRLKTAGDPLRAATVGMLAATSGSCRRGSLPGRWPAGRPCPVEGVALGLLSGRDRGRLLRPAVGGLPAGRPVGRVSDRARDRAAARRGDRGRGFGERLGVAGSVGVVVLLAGFMVLQQPWRAFRGHRGFDPAIAFALATGVTIATYSAVDRLGTRLIDPLPYAAILWVTASIVLVMWVRFVVRRRGVRRRPRPDPPRRDRRLADAGAYLLILWALSVAPLSAVAPLRESATVFAAAWGSVRLGEAVSRRETCDGSVHRR